MKIGIYKIVNLINNKVYIGSSKNIEYRITKHKYNLRQNCHINKHLQSSYNKYGEENFKFEIVTLTKESILRKAEQIYINSYQSLNPKYGYNKTVVESNKWDDKEKLPEIKKSKIYFGAYDKKGNLFKVFKTIQEANDFFKMKKTSIYEACYSDFFKSSCGYFWLKLNVLDQKFPKKVKVNFRRGRHKKIYQYTLDKIFIKEWNSAVEAAKNLKLSSANITRCLKKDNMYKNYLWYLSPLT
jgi:predicted GIY-YIG superfamily endonuclease